MVLTQNAKNNPQPKILIYPYSPKDQKYPSNTKNPRNYTQR